MSLWFWLLLFGLLLLYSNRVLQYHMPSSAFRCSHSVTPYVCFTSSFFFTPRRSICLIQTQVPTAVFHFEGMPRADRSESRCWVAVCWPWLVAERSALVYAAALGKKRAIIYCWSFAYTWNIPCSLLYTIALIITGLKSHRVSHCLSYILCGLYPSFEAFVDLDCMMLSSGLWFRNATVL